MRTTSLLGRAALYLLAFVGAATLLFLVAVLVLYVVHPVVVHPLPTGYWRMLG